MRVSLSSASWASLFWVIFDAVFVWGRLGALWLISFVDVFLVYFPGAFGAALAARVFMRKKLNWFRDELAADPGERSNTGAL